MRLLAVAAALLPLFMALPQGFASEGEKAEPEVSIPLNKGWPVVVRTGLYVLEVKSFDENEGTYQATTDLRLLWTDLRLRYSAEQGVDVYKEFRSSRAEKEIAKIWTPKTRFANQDGEPSFTDRRLRLYPSGVVELITRTTARYKTPIDVEKFPFDHQRLEMDIRVVEDTTSSVALEYVQSDLDFTRAARRMKLAGWNIGIVELKRVTANGWNGDRYAQVTAALQISRQPTGVIAPIFIPLFASLLIPLLILWMNRIEDGVFAVEAFELANVIIGGLFSVIALSFSVNSSYKSLSSGDNTVMRLFGLNYITLALSLGVVILLFRANLPKRLFNIYVQEEIFRVCTWAIPTLALGTAAAFLLIAAV